MDSSDILDSEDEMIDMLEDDAIEQFNKENDITKKLLSSTSPATSRVTKSTRASTGLYMLRLYGG